MKRDFGNWRSRREGCPRRGAGTVRRRSLCGPELRVDDSWPGGDFHKEHQRIYGYSDGKRPTQIVTLRVRATVRVEKPSLRVRSGAEMG